MIENAFLMLLYRFIKNQYLNSKHYIEAVSQSQETSGKAYWISEAPFLYWDKFSEFYM